MSTEQIAAFGSWVLAAVTLVGAFFWGIPVLSRIRYSTRIEKLRDQAFDMALDGLLPMSDQAVQEFIAVQEAFGRSAAHITIPRLIAYNAKFEELGVKAQRRPSRNELTRDQRRTLESLESQSREALARHLLWGSPAGMAGYGAYRLGHAAAALLKSIGQPVRRQPLAQIETPHHVARVTYGHCHEQVREVNQRASAGTTRNQHPDLVCI